ncbi:hypothetical protein [Methylocella sp.]|uniref:hypothetical protein n=1 Tax=Methylocella sp. TaxID=1978226 RepID=UPI0037836C49
MKYFKTSLIAALSLGCACVQPSLADGAGRMLFVNGGTGRVIVAGIDKNGYFQTSYDVTTAAFVGTDSVIPTSAGAILYSYYGGGARAILLDGDGAINPGSSYNFSKQWYYSIGDGNHTLFYDLAGNGGDGAVVASYPDGTLRQTFSSTSFTHWTLLGKTENFLFWYRSSDGLFVTGDINVAGQLTQDTRAATTKTGYTNIAAVGDDILLWNVNSGAWESGAISFSGTTSAYVATAGGSTNSLGLAGVDVAAQTNGHLFLYASATGAALTGHFVEPLQSAGKPGLFLKDQSFTLGKYYTSALRCGQFLTLYGYGTGQIQVGYVGFDGKFQPTQGFTLGGGLSVAATGS